MKKLLILGLVGLLLLNLGCVGTAQAIQKEKITLININTATSVELESLWGVGPVIAGRIIENRPFHSIIDIFKVKGIGLKKFKKMKDLITAETVTVESSSK